MFADTLSREALALLRQLMREPSLADYRLVGGTALALLRGHRVSIDLDLFKYGKSNSVGLVTLFEQAYQAKETRVGDDNAFVSGFVNSIKTDFVAYPYAWLYPPIEDSGIRFADPRDIAAIKMAAIGQRGQKKDFFDFAELLSEYPLTDIVSFFKQKYPKASDFHYLQALTYFEDAERDPEPGRTASSLAWQDVKAVISSAVSDFINLKI